MTPPTPPTSPTKPPLLRCWTSPARWLLIIVALPIGLRFVAGTAPGLDRADPWPALVVDANTAPVPVLEALPGLGPALAGRIAEARQARPFGSLADLDRRVKGIGPAKAAALAPFLRFTDPR